MLTDLVDQLPLYGIIARLRDLGLVWLSVARSIKGRSDERKPASRHKGLGNIYWRGCVLFRYAMDNRFIQ